MGDKTYMIPPIGGKSILRSTGEEVEIIDFNLPNKGMRTETKDLTFEEGDWVTYIDSEGNEHIRERLNIQLDFKTVVNDTFSKLIDIAKPHITTTRNNRIFEVAKALYLDNERGYSVEEAVLVATQLVNKVGIETE